MKRPASKAKIPRCVLGIHTGTNETRIVKLMCDKQGFLLEELQRLPPRDPDIDGDGYQLQELAPSLKTRFVSVASDRSDILVNIPLISGNAELRNEQRVIERMGIKDSAKYRLGYREVSDISAGPRAILAVAFPQAHLAELLTVMPGGKPVPKNVESALLARLTAFGATTESPNEATGVLCIDDHITVLAVLANGVPAVVRSFPLGRENVITCVQRNLGVDRPTAETIAMDGAFDIAGAVTEAMTPLIRQIILSRDFVERHEGVAIRALRVCAPPVLLDCFMKDAATALDVEVIRWSPLDGLPLAKHLDPAELAQDGWRYAAALGTAMGCMEQPK